MYGPVRTVVWQGSAGDCRPYADQVGFSSVNRSERITGYSDRTLRRAAVQQNPSVRPTARDKQGRTYLVDEVADVREDAVIEFHAHQTCTG